MATPQALFSRSHEEHEGCEEHEGALPDTKMPLVSFASFVFFV
jgi:hypothetical protein